jgi:SAM-dependent methyltransferase
MADWDQRYSKGEHINDEPHPVVTRFASKMVPGRALDLACGTGRHALWLAEHGWQVTAVDSSRVAIGIVKKQAQDRGVPINAICADLEHEEFLIEPESYDLIVMVNYLQRDLFASIRAGMRPGGCVIAIGAMVDPDPVIQPMNPAFLLNPGELRAQFEGWELMHDFEGKPLGSVSRRMTAEVVARKRPR